MSNSNASASNHGQLSNTLQNKNEATATTTKADRPHPQWRVWKTADALMDDESHLMMTEPYRSTTLKVVFILQLWGHQWAGQSKWVSLLNKRTLLHEVEESIVALHHLYEWMTSTAIKTKTTQNDSDITTSNGDQPEQQHHHFIAVDVCGGKGLFSMLLSYMASEFWSTNNIDDPPSTTSSSSKALDCIILIEKATNSDIDWNHIHEANARPQTRGGSSVPQIEIWAGTNVHEYDILLNKLQGVCSEKTVLALTGIHLCKMLSPSLVSLFNGLGNKQCPYLCLSPCCLPRMVTTEAEESDRCIPIHLYETEPERSDRIEHNNRKRAAVGRNRKSRVCYVCGSRRHWVRKCPQLVDKTEEERDHIVAQAAAKTPCWGCGMVGHFKDNCPTPEARITTRYAPSMQMDFSKIRKSSTPYETYCQLLSEHIVMNSNADKKTEGSEEPPDKKLKLPSSSSVQVLETGLDNNSIMHQDGNWNSRRKSIYIIAAK